jgi:hypothetical protein
MMILLAVVDIKRPREAPSDSSITNAASWERYIYKLFMHIIFCMLLFFMDVWLSKKNWKPLAWWIPPNL